MSFIQGARRLLSSLTPLLEWILIVAMATLVLDVLWGVLSRHLLSTQSSWTEELARCLLIWVSMLGTGVAFDRTAHLGVDYFVGKLHPSGQRILQIAVLLLVLSFALLVFVGGGWLLVTRTLALGQTTPALGISKAWVYLAVPVSGVFIVLFLLRDLLETILKPIDAEEDK
jgi:TRAP-type C4-dicarboxylate transport system permease small subunit